MTVKHGAAGGGEYNYSGGKKRRSKSTELLPSAKINKDPRNCL